MANNTSGTGSSSAIAAAAASGLGWTALATSTGTSSSTNQNQSCFGAEVVIDDVIISGPGPTATIQVSADIAGIVETAFATADFPEGLSLPTSGPVFTLPAGFTANSTDGDIVDNQFGAPPAVPSLGNPALAVLAALLAALGVAARAASSRATSER